MAPAKDVVRTLLDIGFPADKLGIFVGASCRQLTNRQLNAFSMHWFGVPLHSRSDTRPSFYKQCYHGDRRSVDCNGLCCTLTHLAAMAYAFRDKDRGGLGLPSSAAVLQLEDDAVFGPAAFADSTLQILRAAAADPSWQLLKLGECQTETDDRRVLVKPAQGCDATIWARGAEGRFWVGD